MSRVFDALRQWNRDRGVSSDVFNFEAPPVEEPQREEEQELARVPIEQLDLGGVAEFVPTITPSDHLVAWGDGKELGTEKFRLLHSRLCQKCIEEKINELVLTSAVPEDGKTLIAINLAISMAKHTSLRVLLIEGDLHKPVFANRFGLRGRAGLSDWLRHEDAAIQNHMYHVRESNLWVFPAGNYRENPLGQLQSSRCLDTLKKLRATFDFILIDAPPLLPLADTGYWLQQADGVLLVVRTGNTPRKLLRRGLEIVDPAKIVGVVLNDTEPTERDYYNRYYHSK